MARRSRLSREAVLAAALDVVDEMGFDALTLSVVAENLGVGPSALYSHVDGLDGLRRVVARESSRLLTITVRDAAIGNSGDEALHAVAFAYRSFVLDHPGRFAATVRTRVAHPYGTDDDLHAVFVLLQQARGASVRDAELAARSARSAIHGFVVLEHNEGAPARHDDEFIYLVETLCRGLARQHQGP